MVSGMQFPYGKAPFWIVIATILAGVLIVVGRWSGKTEKPDLVFVTFSRTHIEYYQRALPEFEKKHGVSVQVQLVDQRALTSRLQSAMIAGTAVPDMVEVLTGTMGYFTKGPLEDVGFVDLTDRLREEGLFEKMVESRFSLWTSRGRTFAVPHDVHPVALAYRRDLIEEMGIDVSKIETWDDFAEVGRRITSDTNGDGVVDHYAIDLPMAQVDSLLALMLQRGTGLFDEAGEVSFDSDVAADTICWYVRQTVGPERIAFPAGWGQTLSKTMLDGLVLFYVTPDWRSKQFEVDVPGLAGKMALMPLPSWEPGGRRVSTWGGTGLAITKACERPDLAWELAKFLYLDKDALAERFKDTNIIPPLKAAWNLPEFDEPNEFFSGVELGRFYADMAPDTPPDFVAAYGLLASGKLSEVLIDAGSYFEKNGEAGLREYVAGQLQLKAEAVRRVMKRNEFLFPEQ